MQGYCASTWRAACALLLGALIAAARPSIQLVHPVNLLLYIPMHVSEPTSNLHHLGQCLFGHAPLLLHPHHVRVDVLLVLSGASSDDRQSELRSAVQRMVWPSLPRARVSVEFVQTRNDRYDRRADKGVEAGGGEDALSGESASDAQWVAGPNSVFYDALHNGTVFERHVRHYHLVQQLETDVCAVRAGWLDALVEPMLGDARTLVSGATTRCDCVYEEGPDTCEPLSKFAGDHMQRHINGNAMYRVGADLAAVLARARIKYGNGQPFDLALFWTAQEMGIESRLHSNPLYFNLPCKVDRLRFTTAAYYGTDDIAAVHASWRHRVPALEAVTSRGKRGAPLTLVPLMQWPNGAVDAFLRSLDNHLIEHVVFVAPTQRLYEAASAALAVRIVPAFQDDRLQTPAMAQSEMWPPSASWAGLIATAVARIADAGYAPFVVPPESHAVRNYVAVLSKLASNAVYIGRRTDANGSTRVPLATLTRPNQQQSVDVGLTYAPVNTSVAAMLHAWAAHLTQGHQPTLDQLVRDAHTHGAAVAHLDDDTFVQGGPRLTSGWPINANAMRAGADASLPTNIALVTADASGAAAGMDYHAQQQLATFQLRQARAWPLNDMVTCRTHSAVSRHPIALGRHNLDRVLRRCAHFADFAVANAIDCLVLPGFYLNETRSWVQAFELIDFDQFVRSVGTAHVVPSFDWIDATSSTYVPFARQHSKPHAFRRHSRRQALVGGRVRAALEGGAATAPAGGALPTPGFAYSAIALAPRLAAAVAFGKATLGGSFACVDGSAHSVDQVALYALGQSLDSSISTLRRQHMLHHQPLLLTGAWQAAASSLLVSPFQRVITMADLRNAHASRPHRQWDALPDLHSTLHPLHDVGWAATIETAICWSAQVVVPGVGVLPPVLSMAAIVHRVASHIPLSVLEKDISAVRRWCEKTKTPITRQTPAFQVVTRTACNNHSKVTPLLSVANVVEDGIVFVPADCLAGAADTRQARRGSVYSRLNVLPHSAQILAQPRLAGLLVDGGVLGVNKARHGDQQRRSDNVRSGVAAMARLARLWSRRVVWNHDSDARLDWLRRLSLDMAGNGDGVVFRGVQDV